MVFDDSLILRAVLGALFAGAVAALARRAGVLTVHGQWAAFVIGTIVTSAGWAWAGLLFAYFVVSSALTRFGATRKHALTEGVLSPGGARSGGQVLANGSLFALLVLFGEVRGDAALSLAGLGALAAAAADTWATEVGLLWGGTPRSITTGRLVEPGVSGGVTPAGVGASIAAALLFGLLAPSFIAEGSGTTGAARGVFVAAIAGSLADSLLGATVQAKRWCEPCRTWTERHVHGCGYRSAHAHGIRWMTNDTVNFCATAVGALGALVAAGILA